MRVDMSDAYREACMALGEAAVRERLLLAELERVAAERDDLLHRADHGPDAG